MEMHSQLFLQALYDELVDQFEYCDALGLEDVHETTKTYMQVLLDGGFDATQIAKMMSSYDVWYEYETLRKYGAEIDPNRFLKVDRFIHYYDFIDENWDEMVRRGIKSEDIAKIRFKDGCSTIQDVDYLLKKGFDTETVFNLVARNSSLGLDPVATAALFNKLKEHGLTDERIVEWFETEVVFEHLIDYVIRRFPEEYQQCLGIDLTKYIKRWLDMYDDGLFDPRYFTSLRELPKIITPEIFLDSYTADELLSKIGSFRVFERVAIEYINIGGNINSLARKFQGKLNRARKRVLRDLGAEEEHLVTP